MSAVKKIETALGYFKEKKEAREAQVKGGILNLITQIDDDLERQGYEPSSETESLAAELQARCDEADAAREAREGDEENDE